jgi:hypothetical protein
MLDARANALDCFLGHLPWGGFRAAGQRRAHLGVDQTCVDPDRLELDAEAVCNR